MMDCETGEIDVYDKETGEMARQPQQLFNSETGEPEPTNNVKPTIRKAFRIPKECIQTTPDKDVKMPSVDFANTKMSPVILFLLPTVYFAPIVAIFLGAIEIILHSWAHKKNKTLKNKDIFYQSPLHVIVSEFCACCVDERTKKKITKMQDKTNDKFTKYGANCFRIVT